MEGKLLTWSINDRKMWNYQINCGSNFDYRIVAWLPPLNTFVVTREVEKQKAGRTKKSAGANSFGTGELRHRRNIKSAGASLRSCRCLARNKPLNIITRGRIFLWNLSQLVL